MDILLLGLAFDIFSALCTALNTLFLVFLNLAQTTTTIINISTIIENVYTLLAVIMIFYVTINLMTYLVSPNRMSDKSSGGPKILVKVVITLAMLVFTPTLFSLSRDFQTAVLKENILGKIILSTNSEMNDDNFVATSQLITRVLAKSYITPKSYNKGSDIHTNDFLNGDSNNMSSLKVYAEDNINYEFNWIMAIATSAILCLMIFNFLFDIALRIIKLLFMEIIAPIPILCYPLSSKSSIFGKWIKDVGFTYASLFIKLSLIYFVIYIIRSLSEGALANDNPVIFSLLIVGALLFVKELPKLLQEIFNIKTDGNFSLNPMDRIRQVPLVGGAVSTLGAAVGGLATGAAMGFRARGGLGAVADSINTYGFGEGMKTLGKNTGGALKSGALGMMLGGRSGFSQANFKGTKEAPKTNAYRAGASRVAQAITGDSNASSGIVDDVFNRMSTSIHKPVYDQEKAVEAAKRAKEKAVSDYSTARDAENEIAGDLGLARSDAAHYQARLDEIDATLKDIDNRSEAEKLVATQPIRARLQRAQQNMEVEIRQRVHLENMELNKETGRIAASKTSRIEQLTSSLLEQRVQNEANFNQAVANGDERAAELYMKKGVEINHSLEHVEDIVNQSMRTDLAAVEERRSHLQENITIEERNKVSIIEQELVAAETKIDEKYAFERNNLNTERVTVSGNRDAAVSRVSELTRQHSSAQTTRIDAETRVSSSEANVHAQQDKLNRMKSPYKKNE